MKLKVSKFVEEIIDIEFTRHTSVYIWVVGDQRCAKCHWQLTGDELHPDPNPNCIVALSNEGKRFVFHESCFVRKVNANGLQTRGVSG